MHIKNYQDVIEALYPYLKDYLQSQGIDTSKNFQCINPDHKDSNPSMGIAPSGNVFHCFGCLPGEQEIRTPEGLIPIKDLRIGDQVWTANGLSGIITNWIPRTKNTFLTHTFILDSIMGDNLKFTANHEMLVVKNLPFKVPYLQWDNQRNDWKFEQRARKRNTSSKYRNSLTIQSVFANEVNPKTDYFIFPVIRPTFYQDKIDTSNLIKKYSCGPKNRRILSIPLNEEALWLYGLYCAEGNSYRGGINLTLGIHEKALALKAKLILEKISSSKVILEERIEKNTIQIRTSSTDLENIFSNLFGILAKNKKCPQFFKFLPLSFQKAFFQGVQDGDGTKKTGAITSISKHLIAELQQILINLKIPFSLKKRNSYIDKNNINHSISFRLTPLKQESRNLFFDKIDNQDFCFLRIKDSLISEAMPIVYDITVESTDLVFSNTFLCNHYAVHNCQTKGGIFNAAHFLEGKPLHGPTFISETVSYLADKFGVQLEVEPLTEEQLYELDTYRAYRLASELIIHRDSNLQFDEAVNERGWTRETRDKFGIGCVANYKDFKESLKAAGFSAAFLGDVDLDRKDIFGEDRIIFTIRDQFGRPVGFASRNLSFTDDKKNGAKYVNQRGTGVKCNIYRKSERLYGFDLFLKERKDKDTPVYIFEGYGDVVTAAQSGLWNVCAVGGTALTNEQINLLKQFNCYNIILCLDGDTAGQERTAALLDTVLGNHKDLKVSIVTLPPDEDPDDFIREKGLAEFQKLKQWTAFEWRLSQFPEETDSETLCKSMIPLIVNETSYIAQEKMATVLAKHTGLTLKSIQAEIHRLQNIRESNYSRDREVVLERLNQNLRRNPVEAEFALNEAMVSLFNMAKSRDDDIFSEARCLSQVNEFKRLQEEKDGTFSGFLLGKDLSLLEQALAGNWKKDVWFCLAGKPNAGKTSFLSKLLFSIASAEANNACVIYHSIDDTLEQILPKFVCIAEGSRQLTINQVIDPNYYVQNQLGQNIVNKRASGYSTLQQMIHEGRLIIKDANEGASLAYADMLIQYYKDRYPDRNIVYVLDNFHKLSDLAGTKDERIRFKEMSKIAKNLATKHHILVLTTIEYKKVETGKEATSSDIGESGQIEYDANIIAHVHNELHELGQNALNYHEYNFGDGEGSVKCPRISINITKNKVTGFKNKLWFDFYPAASDFLNIPEKKVSADINSRKETVVSENSDKFSFYQNLLEEKQEKGYKDGWEMFKLMDEYGLSKDEALELVKAFRKTLLSKKPQSASHEMQ